LKTVCLPHLPKVSLIPSDKGGDIEQPSFRSRGNQVFQ
jgi:hypothetical protein